jgi:ferredoxin
MHINRVTSIYFSPTCTTERIVMSIARGISSEATVTASLDLTPADMDTWESSRIQDDLVIIGAPVYGGRIPAEAASRLHRLRADAVPAVVVTVYGNREYEDALLELRDITLELGFTPIAGAAFIGEHSFDSVTTPIATGRPDAQDLKTAFEFGQAIRAKMETLSPETQLAPVQVPGDTPYRPRMDWPAMAPTTSMALCALCGDCAAVCPTAAISVGDTVVTDPDTCIRCTACIKNCPANARVWEHPKVIQAAQWLSTNYRERKEPETYL